MRHVKLDYCCFHEGTRSSDLNANARPALEGLGSLRWLSEAGNDLKIVLLGP